MKLSIFSEETSTDLTGISRRLKLKHIGRTYIMELKEGIARLAEKADAEREKEGVTEEATKQALILPMFSLLGYNIFDTGELCPEYTADFGAKKGKKVDYAILQDGQPIVLVECKSCTEELTNNYVEQLFWYFTVSPAKFGILTNGIEYRFYTDLEEQNKLDQVPFLTFDVRDMSDSQITALSKFEKEKFDQTKILGDAERLKCAGLVENYLAKQLDDMDDEFAKFVIKQSEVRSGKVTQAVLDQYKPVVSRAFTALINEQVNRKITQALQGDEPAEEPEEEPVSKIVTTEEEIESFYIVRGILAGIVPVEDIAYRDRQTYFGILYRDNSRTPICRMDLRENTKRILIPSGDRSAHGSLKFDTYELETLNDIYNYKDKLVDVLKGYLA